MLIGSTSSAFPPLQIMWWLTPGQSIREMEHTMPHYTLCY